MEINFDLSLLRRPLTPFTGFSEAKSAFEKGTAEVRHLLLHECSLIYECNICRNMFRSLANFISHKRVFCCKSALENNDSHDSTSYTETRKSSIAREFLPTKISAELHHKNTPIPISDDDAVPVVAKKSRLSNFEHNQAESKTERGDLGIGSSKNNYATDSNENSSQRKIEQNADQSSTSYVFQCPSCTLTFLKSSSVIRHLALAHNIPMRRIRMLRDTITKRPAETVLLNGDETQPKTKPNRELKNLQIAKAETSAAATTTKTLAPEDEQNSDDEELTKCIFCQKSFERRATLAAHLQTCHIKLEMLEDSKATTTKSPTPSSKRMRLQSNASSAASNKNQTIVPTAAIAADVDFALNEENEDVKRTFAHLEQQDFGGGLQTVSIDKLDISAGESTNASIECKNEVNSTTALTVDTEEVKKNVDTAMLVDNEETAENAVATSSPSNKKRKIRTNSVMKQSCRCKICGKQFNALSNLRRHISMFHYRSRKFGCALCDYCAFRRYDIENHLSFVHKMSNENGNETAKLVRVNDVHYTKDDMDEDIVLLGAVAAAAAADDDDVAIEHEATTCVPTTNVADKTIEKRRRRRNKNLVNKLEKQLVEAKTTVDAVDSTVDIKLTRQTLKRTLSANASEVVHSTTKANQKRPTRNRVKPVNKDFVYELNDVLKKEQAQVAAPSTSVENETYQLRGSKRRNTLNATQTPEVKVTTVPAFEYIKAKHHVTIKGATRRSCLLLVNLGLAASATLPEIPSERPQMRSRLISLQRSDSQAGPIIDSTELDAARLKSLPLCDDSYLEKIAKESVGSFQMKPCLAPQQHSALDTLLQKVDFSKNLFNGAVAAAAANARNQLSNEINEAVVVAQSSCLDSADVAVGFAAHSTNTAMSPCYITPEQGLPKAFVTPSKPQKRLPSLDRLTATLNNAPGDDSYYNATPLLEQ